MIREMEGKVKNMIPVKTVLVSVFDKTGLDQLVNSLIEWCSPITFLSTGGTYKKLKEIIPNNDNAEVIEISDYTGFPEMEGGLVKTLHPKIHAGILGERNNQKHQDYLQQLGNAQYIDLVVVNLYPFGKVIADPNVTFEKARGNIDIGGPTMIRAAAKNFPSCAVLCNPADYTGFSEELAYNLGKTHFLQRLGLAKEVFDLTAKYDRAIADFMVDQIENNHKEIVSYKFEKD